MAETTTSLAEEVRERLKNPISSVVTAVEQDEFVDNPMLVMSKLNPMLYMGRRVLEDRPEEKQDQLPQKPAELELGELDDLFNLIDTKSKTFTAFMLEKVIPLYVGLNMAKADTSDILVQLFDDASREVDSAIAEGHISPIRTLREILTSEQYDRILRNGIYTALINVIQSELDLTDDQARTILIGRGGSIENQRAEVDGQSASPRPLRRGGVT